MKSYQVFALSLLLMFSLSGCSFLDRTWGNVAYKTCDSLNQNCSPSVYEMPSTLPTDGYSLQALQQAQSRMHGAPPATISPALTGPAYPVLPPYLVQNPSTR